MAQHHRAVITFKDINIEQIMAEYAKGAFVHSTMKGVAQSTIVCGANNLLRQEHIECKKTFKGSFGSKVSMFDISPNDNKICHWDHHDFDNESLGLPISMAQKIRVDSDGKEYIHYAFETVYKFCSFECLYAFFQSFKNSNTHNQWITANSELLIDRMFRVLFNNKTLRQAPHWLLTKKYSGHLTINQFRQDHNEYYSCHKMDTISVNNDYIKNEITK